MLQSVALLLLSALAARPSVPASANVVEVCSVAAGTCSSVPAAALDPTLRPVVAQGQLAFVDAHSGLRVAPTAEQLEEAGRELALIEQQRSVEPTFETLADGSVLARGDFRVYLRAELRPVAAAAQEVEP